MEVYASEVRIKNMKTGEETEAGLDGVPDTLMSLIRSDALGDLEDAVLGK